MTSTGNRKIVSFDGSQLIESSVSERFNLRLAYVADAATLESLVQLAYRGGKSKTPWKNEHEFVDGPRITQSALREQIESDSNYILVLEGKSGSKLGIVACLKVVYQAGEKAYLGMLAVHPDVQDQGLAKALLRAAEKLVFERLQCSGIIMSVLSIRTDLLAWYERCGYVQTGEREEFFSPDSGQIAKYSDAHFIVIAKARSAL